MKNNIIERRPFNLSTPQSVIEDYITYGDNTFNAVDDEDEKNLETHNKLRNLDNSLKLYDSMKKYTKKSGKPMPNINWMALDFAPTMKTNKVVKSEKKIKESKLIEAKEKLKPIPQPNQTVQVYKPPTSFKLPSSTEVQNSLRLLTGGDYGKKFEDYIIGLNSENSYKITLTKIDCDENTTMAEKYKIQGYPTIKLIYKGTVYDYDAKPNKQNLIEFLQTSIK